jgi:hypothetical protein
MDMAEPVEQLHVIHHYAYQNLNCGNQQDKAHYNHLTAL